VVSAQFSNLDLPDAGDSFAPSDGKVKKIAQQQPRLSAELLTWRIRRKMLPLLI